MKLQTATIEGLIPFPNTTEIPIQELIGQLVAIVGENGAGKTTAVECMMPGAIYRTTPSRGKLSTYVNGGAASVVAKVDDYDIVHKIDRGKWSAFLSKDGQQLNDGKLDSFDAAIAKVFPPRKVYLASAFGAQVDGSRFLDLGVADRKKLFASMIGCDSLQAIADAAGEKSKEIQVSVTRLEGKLSALEGQGHGPTEEEIVEAVAEVARCEQSTASEKCIYERAKEAVDRWREVELLLVDSHRVASRDVDAANYEVNKRTNEMAEKGPWADQLRDKLAREKELRETVERTSELDDLDSARGSLDALKAELSTYQVDSAKYEAAVQDWETKLERAQEWHGDLAKRAEMLLKVPCKAQAEFSECPLLADARDSEETSKIAARNIDDLEKQGAPPMPTVRPHLVELARTGEAHIKMIEAQISDRTRAETELAGLEEARVELAKTEEASAKLESEHGECSKIATAKAALLAAAYSLLSDHRAKKPIEPAPTDLRAFEMAERVARDELAKLEALKERAEKVVAEVEGVATEYAQFRFDLADWQHLQKAFGRNGIQALEIDNAGPEVSSIINELLHVCYGPRFTCRLITRELKATGKDYKEVFDLVVLDTEKGTEGPASMKSGGEKVIISEALSLAIAIFNTRKSSIRMADLWRDECAGALDENHAAHYVAMLRKALDLGGFDRCYFVSHLPALQNMADAKLIFAGGKVSVG